MLPLQSSTKNLLKTDRDADLPENPVHLAAGHDRLLGKVTLELSSFSELSYLHVRICIYLHVLQYWQDKQYLAETPLCTGAPVALGVTLARFLFYFFNYFILLVTLATKVKM